MRSFIISPNWKKKEIFLKIFTHRQTRTHVLSWQPSVRHWRSCWYPQCSETLEKKWAELKMLGKDSSSLLNGVDRVWQLMCRKEEKRRFSKDFRSTRGSTRSTLFIRLINKEEIVRRGLDDQPTVMPFPCHAKNFLSNLKFTYGFSS